MAFDFLDDHRSLGESILPARTPGLLLGWSHGEGRLEELALWIANNAPDREPVKLAIALLGLLPGPEQHELFVTLGRHEGFTLFAAVALANSGAEDSERRLFELAKLVTGWGRIHLVER